MREFFKSPIQQSASQSLPAMAYSDAGTPHRSVRGFAGGTRHTMRTGLANVQFDLMKSGGKMRIRYLGDGK